jgi:hypothetical protein
MERDQQAAPPFSRCREGGVWSRETSATSTRLLKPPLRKLSAQTTLVISGNEPCIHMVDITVPAPYSELGLH